MSKKIMKRSLVLSALMAFVITGSAWAATVPVENGDTVSWEESGYSYPWQNNTSANKTSDAGDLSGKNVIIKSNSGGTLGVFVDTVDSLNDVKSIEISSGGNKTALMIDTGDSVTVAAPISLTGNGTDARIEIFDGATFTANEIICSATQKGFVQINNNSTANLKKITVLKDSYFSLQTYGNYVNDTAKFNLSELVIEDNAGVKLCIYDSNSNAVINENRDEITMTLGENSYVDFGAGENDNWHGNRMSVNASSLTVNIEDSSAKVYLPSEGEESLKDENIKVIASGNNNTGNAIADLNGLSKVVERTSETTDTTAATTKSAVIGATLIQEASSIYDGAEGTVQADGTAKVENIIKNSNTYGITENNALSLMTWRAEMNDMNKRMGELRNAEGQHGVWARMVRGEAEYESVKNQYNQYQLGYDEKLSTDPSWTVGAAFNYTEGDTSYSTGSAENKNVGFSVYGSKLNADGSFIDLIAKYARLENDFDVLYDNNLCSGDYSSNGYSVSAEYGKRFTKENGLWIEPQVELTYGKVGSADYKLGTVDIAQDSIESLVGRVGFSLGKNISKGNVYARASYLYDFEGETAVNFVDGGKPRTMEQDLGGGWWEVGVGANINLSKATYIYADIEKTFGGEVDTNWQWNLGVRYSF